MPREVASVSFGGLYPLYGILLAQGMLVKEAPRYPPARDPMATTFFNRGNPNTTSVPFQTPNMPGNGRYVSGSGVPNGGLPPAPTPSVLVAGRILIEVS